MKDSKKLVAVLLMFPVAIGCTPEKDADAGDPDYSYIVDSDWLEAEILFAARKSEAFVELEKAQGELSINVYSTPWLVDNGQNHATQRITEVEDAYINWSHNPVTKLVYVKTIKIGDTVTSGPFTNEPIREPGEARNAEKPPNVERSP